MRCKCGRKVQVTHTYEAGRLGKTQRATCECGRVWTIISTAKEVRPGSRGEGARAHAERLRREGCDECQPS